MKVKCKVCGEWFEQENVYCDHCAAKYGSERSNYDINLFEDQKSYTPADQAKIDKRQARKDLRQTSSDETHKVPQYTTETASPVKKKSFFGVIKGLIFFIVFINFIVGFLNYFDDPDNNEFSITEETVVEIIESPELLESAPKEFYGESSPITRTPLGVYEGILFTETYLNYDLKNMRFDLKDKNFSGSYETPIFITIAPNNDNSIYYFDIWDQQSLKMLGTYSLAAKAFTNGTFTGNPNGQSYDDPNIDDLKGTYDDSGFEGRLALPYTIENDVNYFNVIASKINDDPDVLLYDSFWENEYTESFMSDDGKFIVDFYTYEIPQGHPHSSMYYDGVFSISDGDITYPIMPFYLSDEGEIFAYVEYMDAENLIIRDIDINRYMYFDDVDTQLYHYNPVSKPNPLYTLEFEGNVYSNDDNQTMIDGSFYITNRNDGQEDVSKDFTITYIDAN